MAGTHLYPLFYDVTQLRDGWYNVYGDGQDQYRGAFLFVNKSEAVAIGVGCVNLLYRIRVRVK